MRLKVSLFLFVFPWFVLLPEWAIAQAAPSAGSPSASAEIGAAETKRALDLPFEASIFPDPPPGPKRRIARNASIAGTAAGFVLAGWGISVVFRGIANGPDSEGIHQGIALAVSGSLVASVFSAAASYYSSPPRP